MPYRGMGHDVLGCTDVGFRSSHGVCSMCQPMPASQSLHEKVRFMPQTSILGLLACWWGWSQTLVKPTAQLPSQGCQQRNGRLPLGLLPRSRLDAAPELLGRGQGEQGLYATHQHGSDMLPCDMSRHILKVRLAPGAPPKPLHSP